LQTHVANCHFQNAVTISDDTYQTIEAIIAEIDRKLSEQINLILHHEDFQKLKVNGAAYII
jgi:type VI secretion system protein ImpC